ncbi:MAG: aminoacyl-tRNA hydrolase [Phycisphaerae bacterium]
MKLIAGLGNPGPRYEHSRHNMGFRLVAELAQRWQAPAPRFERRFEGLLAEAQHAGQRVLLLQPQTYMNLSGRSVAAVWRYYRLSLADLLVINDELDLPVGRIRLRAGGSSGGHKGLDDVIRCVGDEGFARLRIGIGKVDRSATVEYVLTGFAPQEREVIETAIVTAADAVEAWLARGIAAAMNDFNRKPGGAPTADPPKGDEP